MTVLDDIAAWFGITSDVVGFLVGVLLLVLVMVALSILTESPMAMMFVGISVIVFLVLLNLWPAWTILIILLALGVMLLYGPNVRMERGA